MRDGRLLRGTRLRVRSTLLVKDSGELIEGILCVTAERRDILRRILPDIDAGRDGRRCPAARVVLNGHGDVRNQDALYDIFIGGKIGMREDGRVEIEGHDVRR